GQLLVADRTGRRACRLGNNNELVTGRNDKRGVGPESHPDGLAARGVQSLAIRSLGYVPKFDRAVAASSREGPAIGRELYAPGIVRVTITNLRGHHGRREI